MQGRIQGGTGEHAPKKNLKFSSFFYKFDNFQKPLTAPAVNGFEKSLTARSAEKQNSLTVLKLLMAQPLMVNISLSEKKTEITKFTVFRFFVNVFSR